MVMVHNCGTDVTLTPDSDHDPAISFLHVPMTAPMRMRRPSMGISYLSGMCRLPGSCTPLRRKFGKSAARNAMHKAGGGFILATGCEYPANLSFDKAQVIIDSAKEFGRY